MRYMHASTTTVFYFVRHGQSEGNALRVLSGHTDHRLTKEGREEAKEASKNIPQDYGLVYSSDLIRCKETVEILNTKNLPVVFDTRLRERDFGTLTGTPWDERTEEEIEKDRTQTYDYRPFGGESAEEVQARLFACIEDMKKVADGRKVLVVTSGGVIRMLHLRHKNEEHRHIKNASVHEFEL